MKALSTKVKSSTTRIAPEDLKTFAAKARNILRGTISVVPNFLNKNSVGQLTFVLQDKSKLTPDTMLDAFEKLVVPAFETCLKYSGEEKAELTKRLEDPKYIRRKKIAFDSAVVDAQDDEDIHLLEVDFDLASCNMVYIPFSRTVVFSIYVG